MKVLVTGANGFLGREVVAALLARGHEVRALVRPAAKLERLDWPDEVEVQRVDLRAGGDLEAAFQGIDVLCHLATTMVGDDFTIFSGTVLGTERLLDAMAKSQVRRIVLCSSFSTYDWLRVETLTEDSPTLDPPYAAGGYAAAKLWQERLARRAAETNDWKLTILRPGFIWGEGNEDLPCVGQKVGPLNFVFGPWRQLALTHVENCADAFARAVENEELSGEVLNVDDDHGVTASDFARERLRRSSKARGIRVPLPYMVVRLGVWAVNLVSRGLFGERGKLPSMFVPVRFDLRYKPVKIQTKKIEQKLSWKAPLSFEACCDRTWPRERRPGPARVASS